MTVRGLPNGFAMVLQYVAVADPGFPIGGCRPRRGVPTPEAATFRKNLYVKMKESGPIGACASGTPWIRHCVGACVGICMLH